MHVFLDARAITTTPSGVARYAQALIPRLIEQRPQWRWSVLRHASNREPFAGADEMFVELPLDGLANWLGAGRVYREAFERVGEPDVVHNLFHLLPRNLTTTARVVVTAHDFIWIDHPEISQDNVLSARALQLFAGHVIPRALRRADRVIAVSESTAERAAPWIDPARLVVIGHGVDPQYFDPPPAPDPIVEHLVADGGRYVIAVGNDKHYKNLHTLVRAFARVAPRRSSLRLVLVGECTGLAPLAAELGVADRVVPVGFLGDEDLRRVVGHASAFVFPSLVEGFGLPPLEAMALGVPTIVSDVEPMRSVTGDAALHFEPTDVAALAELLTMVIDDELLSSRLAEAGRRRATAFDWDRAAARTLDVYS